MATIDQEHERQRLSEVYAGQTDGELEQVAAQSNELTDLAREVLRSELSHRGLYSGQLDGPEPTVAENSVEFRDLVIIRSFWNLIEAELAKGLLDAAGIESFLFDDNMVRLDWFNANALGGVKLRVDAQNAEAADQLLRENVSGDAAALADPDQRNPSQSEDPSI